MKNNVIDMTEHVHVSTARTSKRGFAPEAIQQPSFDFDALFVLPRTPLERMLVDIWCEVLDIPYVGIHNSFFDLGGDALNGIEMHCLAQDKGLNFSFQQFLRNPTIFDLTRLLHDEHITTAVQDVPRTLIA